MGRSVMIVDDNSTVRLLAAKVLNAEGYEPMEAESGAEATRLLASSDIALALVDARLPDGCGYELVQRWRASGIDMPVVLTSGYPRDEVIPEDAAEPFLGKPFRPDTLRRAVADALSR